MTELRILIVEDERLVRDAIRSGLASLPDTEIIGECNCGSEAIAAIRARRPDLILLDIQMQDLSGLDVIRQIGPDRMPPVVFVTAYDEYAVKAFELNAVDYIVKPFDEQRLIDGVERARQRIRERDHNLLGERLRALIDANQTHWPERLVVRNGERFEMVSVDSIDWIESANNYALLHCGPRQHLLGETLKSLEERLDPARFARIHRCRIVNLSRIMVVHILLGGAYEVELRGGTRLVTGRQYKHAIHALIKDQSD